MGILDRLLKRSTPDPQIRENDTDPANVSHPSAKPVIGDEDQEAARRRMEEELERQRQRVGGSHGGPD